MLPYIDYMNGVTESKRQNAIFVFAFTADDHLDDPKYYKEWCKKWGKHWCFQLERGSQEQKLHYQGIISLKVKRRENEFKKLLKDEGELPRRISAAATNNVKGGSTEFYVTKPDGRVAGPWSDKDKVLYIQSDLRGLETRFYPWQQTIFDQKDQFQPRTINVIVDKIGGLGKSTFVSWMDQMEYGMILHQTHPDFLVSSICDALMPSENRNPKMFFLDMARASNQTNPHQLYVAIEIIKNGVVYDVRYHYRKWVYEKPQVWVFCNTLPDMKMLSLDRWRFWQIDPLLLSLVPLDPLHTEVNRHTGYPVREEVSLGASLSLHRDTSSTIDNTLDLWNHWHQNEASPGQDLECSSSDMTIDLNM